MDDKITQEESVVVLKRVKEMFSLSTGEADALVSGNTAKKSVN